METAINTSQNLRQVYHLMKLTFGLVPIVAGLDKFTNLLTHWEKYLHPSFAALLPMSPHSFMMIVGIIEIIAGLIVLTKPVTGGYIVMAWLTLIGISLVLNLDYLDVAVRDFVMAISAYSFAQIAQNFATSKIKHATKREVAFSNP